MKYTNLRLIHVPQGIPVTYNRGERNLETVFAFDEHQQYLQGFTYMVDDLDSPVLNDLLKNKNQLKIVEDSFLFYAFQYQISFAHYLYQCVPKLKHYLLHHSGARLVVPRSTYTQLAQEILEFCKIPISQLLILEDNIVYEFSTLYTVPHDYQMCLQPDDDIIFVLETIRQQLNLKPSTTERRIYLKKDGLPNSKYGNLEIGVNRRIINEPELLSYLQSLDFEIITLGDKSLSSKAKLLANAKVIITQVGANCMNLAFTNRPEHLLLLSNDHPIGVEYYVSLSGHLNQNPLQYQLFIYPTLRNMDHTNPTNGEFEVSLVEIKKYLDTIL